MRTLPLLLCLAAFAQAASVTWTTSTVSGPSDVNTAGTLVGAMNVGTNTAQTVNGVAFAADTTASAGPLALGSATVAFGNLGNSFPDFWTVDDPGDNAAYAAALDAGRWGNANSGTVTLGGLTVGRSYLVQLWITDTRSGANARVRTVDGTATTSGGPGNMVTGLFVADATTQVITVDDGVATFGPQVNLLQVRDISATVVTTGNSGAGSLRQSLIWAASVAGANTITFAPALSGQTITLASEIVISDSGGVTVDASALADGITIHGGPGGNRLFSTSSGTVTLTGLNLTGGGGSTGSGGAISNTGTLVVNRCTFHGNSAGDGSGGAIYSIGTLTMTQCTLSGNSSAVYGGGILATGSVSLNHVTLGNNTAGERGGAIYLVSGTLTLANSAIGGNSALTFPGIENLGTLTRVGTSIVQAAPGGTGTVTGAGTLNVADPLLGALGDYGGPTLTMRPRFASPVLNEATTSAITTDQRGFAITGAADAGACEANAALPTIGDITNRTINEDSATAALAFTIGDSETAATALTVSGSSNNSTLVPNGNITFGGSGANRTVTVTPAANQNGTATITVTVSDGSDTAQDTFLLTVTAVNDAPTITNITDKTINEDTALSALAFTIGDSETAAGSLTVSGSSNNSTLVPNGNITFGGSGVSRTVTVTPAANQFGSATITVTVSDGSITTQDTFLLTVNAVADTPSVSNTGTNEDTQTTSGLVITRNAADGTEVTHFKITDITNGTLFQNNGTSTIGANSFITVAQGNAGLKFTPAANFNGTASFTVQASTSAGDAGLGGGTVTATITVVAVVDTPSVTNTGTNEDTQTTSGLVITRNAADSTEVTHFKITDITNGTLFQNDATTTIGTNSFITVAEGNAGLKFTPAANFNGTGSFTVQASTSDGDAGLGGGTITATITVNAVNDPPTLESITDPAAILEDAAQQTIALTGIGTGALNETQTLTVTATSGDTALIPHPTVTYNSPQATGTLSYTPVANASGTAVITVTVNDGQLANNTITHTFTVIVNPVADTPGVTAAATPFNTQSTSGLVISRNAADGTEVTHFKITAITNGTLFQNDGTTGIAAGGFITFAQGNAGLRFTPAANFSGTGSFTVQSSISADDAGLGGNAVSATITVANAATLIVTNTADSGTGSLRAQIAASLSATGSRSIVFDPGLSGQTITLSSEIVLDDSNNTGADALTIDASILPGGLTIHGGSGTNRIFSLASGDRANLRSVTLTGGNGTGALSSGSGGAIHNQGTLTLTQCTLSGNSASSGGAIFNNFATLTLTQCTLSGNSASFGGAIYNGFSTLTLTQCTLSGNSASFGGAIRAHSGTLTMTQCTLSGNHAANNGGVIDSVTGLQSLSQCTLSGNSASSGGAIYNDTNGTLNITHSLIAGNTAPLGPDIRLLGTLNRNGVNLIGKNDTVTTQFPAGQPNANGDFVGTSAAALNPQLAALASNGGPTQTRALLSDSPALNRIASPLYATDQRGHTIVGAADIGAYEYGAFGPLAPFSIAEDTTGTFGITLPSPGPEGLSLATFSASASSNNATLLPPGNITVTGTGLTRTVTVTPAANVFGTVTVFLTFTDGISMAGTSFLLTVTPVNDDPPTLAVIADPTAILEDAAQQTVSLSGISDGDAGTQPLTVTATSSNTALILNPIVTYTSPQSTGTLRYTPVANASGTATITVTVNDGQPADHTITRTFTVAVTAVNDPPTLTALSNQVLAPSAGMQTVNLTGISTGPADETETLTITATSNNTALIPNPDVTYTSPDATGSLSFTPAAGQTGLALVTVTVSDENTTTSRTFYVSVPVNPASNVTHPGDSGSGSLRQAIANALAATGSQSITFDPVLSGHTITLASEIVIDDSNSANVLTIDATSLPAGLTIDGGPGTNRIFYLNSGDRADLRGLTLTGGNGTGASNSGTGGAIYNSGTLTLTQCTLSGNSASSGGAIYNTGTLTLTQCTLSGNSASSGGAIYNNSATLALTQCTLSGNSAGSSGGAIYNSSARPPILTNSLIAGNTAPTGPDILLISGTLNRNGVNLIGNNGGTTAGNVSTQFPADSPNPNGDYVGTSAAPLNPLLAPLANNGSPTQTRRLLPGSPALNRSLSVSEVQLVDVGGSSSNQFSLTFGTASTPLMANNASATTVQTALNALSTINTGGGSVTVTGGSRIFLVIFNGGPLAGVNQPALIGTGTGSTTVTVSTLVDGGSPFTTDQRGFPIVGLADIGAYESGARTLASIADQVALSGIGTGAIPFPIGTAGTTAAPLTLTATSGNLTLVPNANAVFGGSGADRTITVTPAAGETGTATLSLTVTDGYDPSSTSFNVTVLENTPFNAWKLAEFGNNAATPAIAGDSADFDNDGQTTLLEYATRGNPLAFTANPFSTLTQVAGPAYQFTFPYRPGVTDLRYIVQRSSTLSGWTEIYRLDLATNQITEQGNVTADENPTSQIITITDPDFTPGNCFWKLVVERPQ